MWPTRGIKDHQGAEVPRAGGTLEWGPAGDRLCPKKSANHEGFQLESDRQGLCGDKISVCGYIRGVEEGTGVGQKEAAGTEGD